MITYLAIHFVCAVLCHGITFGYFHREYPYISKSEYWLNIGFSIMMSFFGPIGLIAALFTTNFGFKHGLKFW